MMEFKLQLVRGCDWKWRLAPVRSADWQSAVSPNGIRQGGGTTERRRTGHTLRMAHLRDSRRSICATIARHLQSHPANRPWKELAFDPPSGQGWSVDGEMAEWFKAHAWKACVANPHRGFKSHSLRHLALWPQTIRLSRFFQPPAIGAGRKARLKRQSWRTSPIW